MPNSPLGVDLGRLSGPNQHLSAAGATPRHCADVSRAENEPLAGTAPSETGYLFVEHPGAWAAKAFEASRLPERVRYRVAALPDLRGQLLRRPDRRRPARLMAFAAWFGSGQRWVRVTELAGYAELESIDLDALAAGTPPTGWAELTKPTWLVCTNAARDVCCARYGRGVYAALNDRWPDQTWETSHLGGHRFAGTLAALPSGTVLGRIDHSNAVGACEALLAGGPPESLVRGRLGQRP